MIGAFSLKPVPSDRAIDFAASGIMSELTLFYIFFVIYLRGAGMAGKMPIQRCWNWPATLTSSQRAGWCI